MLVSIGIPTYNRADGFLRNALESALAQTYKNIEIIVSDNCSTDNTGEFIKSYSDKRIRYFRQKNNIGVEGNFNYCVEQARGEYFLLLCDDDLIDPDFVECCLRNIDGEKRPGLIRTGTRYIDEVGTVMKEKENYINGNTIDDFIKSWFESKTAFFMCSTLFHTESLKNVGGFHSKMNLYLDVVPEIKLAATKGFVGIPDVKASFRRHTANNGTARKVEDWVADSHHVLDVIFEHIHNPDNGWKRTGMVYFSKQNYHRANRIPSPVARWVTYLKIYKSFNYAYSPFSYRLKRYKPFVRAKIRRIIKN